MSARMQSARMHMHVAARSRGTLRARRSQGRWCPAAAARTWLWSARGGRAGVNGALDNTTKELFVLPPTPISSHQLMKFLFANGAADAGRRGAMAALTTKNRPYLG